MKDLYIEATKKTPEIRYNTNGILIIQGRSIPEDPLKFYEPVLQWLDDYAKTPANHTEACFQLDYFNSGSSKVLLVLLKKLVEIKERYPVTIRWCYETGDDDIFERGDYFSAILETDFEFVEIKTE